MILFRSAHPDFPFLWESNEQPAARWHAEGEGPAHYFATTADGAWAELLRQEEIVDPDDLKGIAERAMWVVTLDSTELDLDEPDLTEDVLTGGRETHSACQREASRLRKRGSKGLQAPSAALRPGGAVRYSVNGGLQLETVDSHVIVLFGSRPDLKGQLASIGGRPHPRILEYVRHL